MKKTLSRLNKIELRDVWEHEAIDFTNWLARQENLDLLSEEIGIEIKPIQTEADVGKFNVDILAEEENSSRKIIIENQLEKTNHDHLGKIITYASGLDAEIIIWIVKDVREEHQKAIDWLNEHTDEKINFFLLKIELWQIEGSNPAPKFEIIVSPNEWAKAIKTSAENEELNGTKLQQLEFWDNFRNYIQEIDKSMHLQKPQPQHWYVVRMGSSDWYVSLTIRSKDNMLGCEVYIDNNKDLFNYLYTQKDKIEQEVGESMEWINAKIASRIVLRKNVKNIFDKAEVAKSYDWFHEKTLLFQKIFKKYLQNFKSI